MSFANKIRSLHYSIVVTLQAVCSPSRTSLLTGRRIDTTRVYDLTRYWREVAGNFTTIPQYFKEHGYLTLAAGKIFHPGVASGNDDPASWTLPNWQPDLGYWTQYQRTTWHAASADEVAAHPLIDMQTAEHAIHTLNALAPKAVNGDSNFFLAVGFHKPHLPFIFPASFLDHYPEKDIHLPANPYAPTQLPEIAWSNFDELRWYKDIAYKYGHGTMNTTLPDVLVKQLRRAYYAAVSYTDSLVGQVIGALEHLGLADSTVISFFGDHGWQLGEHGEWCKHTNFELATHAPMMLRVPGLTDKGVVTEELTEFVDLFPTLAEAAGLPEIPLCPERSGLVSTCTEGTSFMPLVAHPQRPWKTGAFSQYPRMLMDGDTFMGYRLRTDLYSYTEWVYYDPVHYKPRWNIEMNIAELYDVTIDPEENINRAYDADYQNIRDLLSRQLRAGWRKSLPPGY